MQRKRGFCTKGPDRSLPVFLQYVLTELGLGVRDVPSPGPSEIYILVEEG